MNYNAAIIAQAEKHVGEKETPGQASNPMIEAHFAKAGFPGMKDDVPWCAAFIGSVLAECGLKPSGSLMARSYVNWGRKISQQDAQIGDIGVIPRGKPPSGHVFFIAGFQGANVLALGGNQSDSVSIKSIPMSSLIAIRRADPIETQGQQILRKGSRGPDVTKLQKTLSDLGYHSGRADGIFGSFTEKAVVSFQAGNPPLEADGVVGDRTWAVLDEGNHAPKRFVTATDLSDRGSKIIKATDAQSTAAVIGIGGVSIEAVRGALSVAQEGQGTLQWFSSFVQEQWVLVLILAALGIGWYLATRIRKERVRKAVDGEDVSL